MSSLDDAASFSALIAPIIDRVAISVHNEITRDELTALRGAHRFHPAAFALFAGTMAAGPISREEFSELTRYQHFGSTDSFVDGLSERGAITVDQAGSLVPTAAGTEVAQALVRVQVAAVTKLFSPINPLLHELRALITMARASAVADPLSMLARYSDRAWLPDDASDAAHIWDASVVLRMHRSDAHAAAWKEAGRTVTEMRAMGPGEVGNAIEMRTNALAAAPWKPLDAEQRLRLMAGLGALPGTGAPIG